MIQWKVDESNFGDIIQINGVPTCDMILLCADTNLGHKPIKILHRHQLYAEDLYRLSKELGVKSFTIMPYDNEDKIEIKVAELKDIMIERLLNLDDS